MLENVKENVEVEIYLKKILIDDKFIWNSCKTEMDIISVLTFFIFYIISMMVTFYVVSYRNRTTKHYSNTGRSSEMCLVHVNFLDLYGASNKFLIIGLARKKYHGKCCV